MDSPTILVFVKSFKLRIEVWGIFIGLKMALNLHIKSLEIERDSVVVVVVNLIHSDDQDLHPLATLIDNCRILMRSFDHWNLHHVHRESNVVVDLLVKDNITCSRGTIFFGHPPAHIVVVVLDNIDGVEKSRSMNLNSSRS